MGRRGHKSWLIHNVIVSNYLRTFAQNLCFRENRLASLTSMQMPSKIMRHLVLLNTGVVTMELIIQAMARMGYIA